MMESLLKKRIDNGPIGRFAEWILGLKPGEHARILQAVQQLDEEHAEPKSGAPTQLASVRRVESDGTQTEI